MAKNKRNQAADSEPIESVPNCTAPDGFPCSEAVPSSSESAEPYSEGDVEAIPAADAWEDAPLAETRFALDLGDPSRIFVEDESILLSVQAALGILVAALEEQVSSSSAPLASGDPASVTALLREFFRTRRGGPPRYVLMGFDPGSSAHTVPLPSVEIRRFIDACKSVLDSLATAPPAGEVFAIARARGYSAVEAMILTVPQEWWEPSPMPAPNTDRPVLDVPLLPEDRQDTRGDRGSRDRARGRIDSSALENRAQAIDEELTRLQQPVILRYQAFLDQLAGEACPNAEDNHKLAKRVLGQAERLGLALFFARDGNDSVPVTLRYTSGVFEAWPLGPEVKHVYSGDDFPPLRVGARPQISDNAALVSANISHAPADLYAELRVPKVGRRRAEELEHSATEQERLTRNVIADLRSLGASGRQLNEQMVVLVQERLDALAGKTFGSFAANKTVVEELNAVIEGQGIRLVYAGPKEEHRGRVVNMRVYENLRSTAGAFHVRLAEAKAAKVSAENGFPRLKAVASPLD